MGWILSAAVFSIILLYNVQHFNNLKIALLFMLLLLKKYNSAAFFSLKAPNCTVFVPLSDWKQDKPCSPTTICFFLVPFQRDPLVIPYSKSFLPASWLISTESSSPARWGETQTQRCLFLTPEPLQAPQVPQSFLVSRYLIGRGSLTAPSLPPSLLDSHPGDAPGWLQALQLPPCAAFPEAELSRVCTSPLSPHRLETPRHHLPPPAASLLPFPVQFNCCFRASSPFCSLWKVLEESSLETQLTIRLAVFGWMMVCIQGKGLFETV